MANTDLVLSLPDSVVDGSSRTLITGTPAWAYSGWRRLYTAIPVAVRIYGISFQLTDIPTVDTAEEYIIELATGSSGNEVIKLQIPYSMRSDTAVGIYLANTAIVLPEPLEIAAGATISMRAAAGVAARTVNAIRLRYTATRSIWVPESYSNNYMRLSAGSGVSTSIGGSF